jgi:hypothetical protein
MAGAISYLESGTGGALMPRAVLVLLCLGSGLVAAQDAKIQDTKAGPANIEDRKIDETGKTPLEAKFAGGRIRMDLCPGDIELLGTDDPALRVSYQPERQEARVRMEVFGDRADLRVSECPHHNFRVRIDVPKSSALYVRMFAGHLEIGGIAGDKDVELVFGQMSLDVGKREDYGHVDASVNSGAINASAFDVNKGGLFRSFDTTGPGKYKLHAHVGAGEVDLR